MAMPYRSWDKMAEDTQRDLRKQAAGFLEALDGLPRYEG
jgi:deoxyribodipyrimidine photolyase-related protein